MKFDRQIQTALRLIEKYGTKAVWNSIDNGTPIDEEKDWIPTAEVIVEYEVDIVLIPITSLKFLQYITNTDISTSSTGGLLGKVPFNPVLKDSVIISEIEYKVEEIEVISPDAIPILYTLRLKQ